MDYSMLYVITGGGVGSERAWQCSVGRSPQSTELPYEQLCH